MSVFGALNRFISRFDSEGLNTTGSSKQAAAGFQVLRNKDQELPVEPWYDFVIGINGRYIDTVDPHLFATEVRNCAGSSVTLTLWNAKGQQLRDLSISVPSASPSLGVTLQWAPLSASEDVWHILEVIPNSPADIAGLLPYGDYVVGTPEGIVRGESGLGELVEDYLSRPLRLYVYNHEYGVTRLVTITPSRSWGGEGALGCVLGFGALHRLPPSLAEPPAAPGDTLFETTPFAKNGRFQATPSPTYPQLQEPAAESGGSAPSNLLVPVAMSTPPAYTSAASPTPGRLPRKKRGAASPNSAFDEVWKESEAKSREDDFVSKSKPASLPRPPPKAEVPSDLAIPPISGGEPRQTRSPAPILDDDDE